MIELICDKNRAFFRETEKLTSGSIGVTINFVFSPEWDGLLKTAVFDAGEAKIDVVLTSESCEIPPEVLACPGKQLSVGVFGELADKTLVIPTIYAETGRIRPGASPSGISSAPPTPSWPEQVQAIALEAKEAADSVRSAADAGEFNGPAGKAGGFYTPAVTQPDANTIRMSFTPSKEDMPAVKDTDIKLPSGGSGSVAVDSTLTASGKAADAKATGDAIRSLSEEIVTTSESKVAAHNTGTDTHSDIRLLIQGLTDRLNALADSDDTTLDQLSEVVAYIKSNRSLIEAITTSKVSVADIVDNLTTNVSNKPLSAAQGVGIKTLIDALRNDKLDAAELDNAVNTALAQAKASGEFDGADGKSAYRYAVDGGFTGTEAEFAAKLAAEKLANPNALTFTGAVTGSYDGSEAVSVEIPQGGGIEWQTILTGETTVEAVTTVTIPMTASDFDEYRAVIVVGKNTDGTTTNNNTNIWIDGYLCAYYMLGINYGNYVGTFSISVEPIPETRFLESNGNYASYVKKSTVDSWVNNPLSNGSSGTKAILCRNTSPTGVLQIKFGTAYSGTIIHEVMAR